MEVLVPSLDKCSDYLISSSHDEKVCATTLLSRRDGTDTNKDRNDDITYHAYFVITAAMSTGIPPPALTPDENGKLFDFKNIHLRNLNSVVAHLYGVLGLSDHERLHERLSRRFSAFSSEKKIEAKSG